MAQGLAIGRRHRHRNRRKPLLISLAAMTLLAGLVGSSWKFDWVRIKGISMCPALEEGDLLMLDGGLSPNWGDVVLVQANGREGLRRVLGLPGETIEMQRGRLKRDGTEIAQTPIGLYQPTNRSHRFPDQIMAMEEGVNGIEFRVLGEFYQSLRPWPETQFKHRLGPDEFMLWCDNRRVCPNDARRGPVAREQLKGVVIRRFWPWDNRS